jgi:hypothetical protein
VHGETQVELNSTTTAIVQVYLSPAWQPIEGATLTRGTETFTTDSNGQVSLSWSENGAYYLVATAENRVRSAKIFVVAGEAGEQASLPLSVTISNDDGGGGGNPPEDGAEFGVSGNLNFGTIAPGESATREATLTNNSSSSITTTASVDGATLFVDNLTLDNVVPNQWQKGVSSNSSASVDVTLDVPNNYTETGAENGTLIFWANTSQ